MVKILVVEDHPVMRPTLRDLLELEGYSVAVTVDGMDALSYLEKDKADLVITDFRMPRMDGLDLLKSLRADPRYLRLPVLMFTAVADPDICVQALAAGANEFLIRPITVRALLEAVQRLTPAWQNSMS